MTQEEYEISIFAVERDATAGLITTEQYDATRKALQKHRIETMNIKGVEIGDYILVNGERILVGKMRYAEGCCLFFSGHNKDGIYFCGPRVTLRNPLPGCRPDTRWELGEPLEIIEKHKWQSLKNGIIDKVDGGKFLRDNILTASKKDIAEHYGCSTKTIATYIEKHGM